MKKYIITILLYAIITALYVYMVNFYIQEIEIPSLALFLIPLLVLVFILIQMFYNFSKTNKISFFPISSQSIKIRHLESRNICDWLKRKGFSTSPNSELTYIYKTNISINSFGEKITVFVDKSIGIITIKSEPRSYLTLTDYGKNHNNVSQLIDELSKFNEKI